MVFPWPIGKKTKNLEVGVQRCRHQKPMDFGSMLGRLLTLSFHGLLCVHVFEEFTPSPHRASRLIFQGFFLHDGTQGPVSVVFSASGWG